MTGSAFASPYLIGASGDETALTRLPLSQTGQYDEAWLQDLVFRHPSLLPVTEIDPDFGPLVPLCRELRTEAGNLDLVFVTPRGQIAIVETKLWRNVQARREVIGQALDYAASLSRWRFDRLDAAIKQKSGRTVLETVKDKHSTIDEAAFSDRISRDLQEGRFLLLVCGDGIRQNVADIAEYLERHTTLGLTFGLVELAIFASEEGLRLVQPRILARTEVIPRQIKIDRGTSTDFEPDNPTATVDDDPSAADRLAEREFWYGVWRKVVDAMAFDNPAQSVPAILGQTNTRMSILPVSNAPAWVTLYFAKSTGTIGTMLRFSNDEMGQRLFDALKQMRSEIDSETGVPLRWSEPGKKPSIAVTARWLDPSNPALCREAAAWFALSANAFANLFRDRLRDAYEDATRL